MVWLRTGPVKPTLWASSFLAALLSFRETFFPFFDLPSIFSATVFLVIEQVEFFGQIAYSLGAQSYESFLFLLLQKAKAAKKRINFDHFDLFLGPPALWSPENVFSPPTMIAAKADF